MDKSNAVKEIFGDIVGDDELEQTVVEVHNTTKEDEIPSQFIVYFKGDSPDTVWEYIHHPKGDVVRDINGKITDRPEPYGRLYGYYEEDTANKVTRHFVEHKSNNLKKMPFDTFMDNVVPNKGCTKLYDSEADFLLDLL